MKSALQRWFGEIGESACYALSIIALSEPFARHPYTVGDVSLLLESFILKKDEYQKQYIYYNEKDYNDPDNFLVQRPDLMLRDLVGGNWQVRKVLHEQLLTFVASPDELVINQYRRKTPKGVFYHFCTPTYDPLGDSLTRTQGELYSLRVFRRV